MSKPKLNKRFNRHETDLGHYYLTEMGGSSDFGYEYDGYLKCKLGHGQGKSLIIPELIFLGKDYKFWIQPLAFLPNQLFKNENEYSCFLYCDISAKTTVKISFTNKCFVKSLRDFSQIYSCKISSVENLQEHYSGTSEVDSAGDILIDMYHHTTTQNVSLIESSGNFRGSSWNIQGTKNITNTNFVYLTWLNKIIKNEDLKVIAMSSNGTIDLRRDFSELPKVLPPDWKTRFARDVKVLTVYREDTKNRRSAIKLGVACDCLAPQHLYMHMDQRGGTYYQITNPYIHRIPISPGSTLAFGPEKIIKSSGIVLDYCIVGDACDLDGLEAPFDEEETDFIMKYENTTTNYLEFWFSNGNQDLFSGKGITKLEF